MKENESFELRNELEKMSVEGLTEAVKEKTYAKVNGYEDTLSDVVYTMPNNILGEPAENG